MAYIDPNVTHLRQLTRPEPLVQAAAISSCLKRSRATEKKLKCPAFLHFELQLLHSGLLLWVQAIQHLDMPSSYYIYREI